MELMKSSIVWRTRCTIVLPSCKMCSQVLQDIGDSTPIINTYLTVHNVTDWMKYNTIQYTEDSINKEGNDKADQLFGDTVENLQEIESLRQART